LVLIEEAENHLSHSNLNALIEHISKGRGDRQLLITTHSSFVLNKLGFESVLLFGRAANATLKHLTRETQEYFLKLPGHDTLRLILAQRAILVEGPSDELIVQAAFKKKHGKMPLEGKHPAKAAMVDCQAAAAGVSRCFQCQGNSSCSWEAG
jgi:predicted ATP-dependent endonuclease of OLD family